MEQRNKDAKQILLDIDRTCSAENLKSKDNSKETYKDKAFRPLKQDIESKQEKNFEEF